MGGDNYRIGMGGAAVSSADTGEFSTGSNQMQFRDQTQKCKKE